MTNPLVTRPVPAFARPVCSAVQTAAQFTVVNVRNTDQSGPASAANVSLDPAAVALANSASKILSRVEAVDGTYGPLARSLACVARAMCDGNCDIPEGLKTAAEDLAAVMEANPGVVDSVSGSDAERKVLAKADVFRAKYSAMLKSDPEGNRFVTWLIKTVVMPEVAKEALKAFGQDAVGKNVEDLVEKSSWNAFVALIPGMTTKEMCESLVGHLETLPFLLKDTSIESPAPAPAPDAPDAPDGASRNAGPPWGPGMAGPYGPYAPCGGHPPITITTGDNKNKSKGGTGGSVGDITINPPALPESDGSKIDKKVLLALLETQLVMAKAVGALSNALSHVHNPGRSEGGSAAASSPDAAVNAPDSSSTDVRPTQARKEEVPGSIEVARTVPRVPAWFVKTTTVNQATRATPTPTTPTTPAPESNASPAADSEKRAGYVSAYRTSGSVSIPPMSGPFTPTNSVAAQPGSKDSRQTPGRESTGLDDTLVPPRKTFTPPLPTPPPRILTGNEGEFDGDSGAPGWVRGLAKKFEGNSAAHTVPNRPYVGSSPTKTPELSVSRISLLGKREQKQMPHFGRAPRGGSDAPGTGS